MRTSSRRIYLFVADMDQVKWEFNLVSGAAKINELESVGARFAPDTLGPDLGVRRAAKLSVRVFMVELCACCTVARR